MKTHRIILPAAWHAKALAGVERLLLPMKTQPDKHFRVFRCICGVEAMPLTDDTKCKCEDIYLQDWEVTNPRCPYTPADRLALLEPWGNPSLNEYKYRAVGGNYHWKPASRMPLSACRCWYRVEAVEPVRLADISETGQVHHLRTSKLGRMVCDWAWSIQVAVMRELPEVRHGG